VIISPHVQSLYVHMRSLNKARPRLEDRSREISYAVASPRNCTKHYLHGILAQSRDSALTREWERLNAGCDRGRNFWETGANLGYIGRREYPFGFLFSNGPSSPVGYRVGFPLLLSLLVLRRSTGSLCSIGSVVDVAPLCVP